MQSHVEIMESVIGESFEITIPRWFDRHLHIREGEMLKTVLPCTLKQRAIGAIIMGNLKNPVSTVERALAYEKEIEAAIPKGCDFKPCLALYLTDDISPLEVVEGFKQDLWRAVKLYMANQKGQGGTTGSAHGVKNLLGRYPVFEEMQKWKIPLLGHFEAVEEDVDEFDREIVSMDRDLLPILTRFPQMPVVFEHITDGRAANFVAGAPYNIHATVTAHHLILNRNAMFWGGMNPAHYCKPVPKREDHRRIVRSFVSSGNTRFGAGTDSAPHPEDAKARCYGCSAGIFTAPTAVELYASVFEEDGRLENLGAFLSENFLNIYNMEVSKEVMTIRHNPLQVPENVGSVKVFMGGKILPWKLLG